MKLLCLGNLYGFRFNLFNTFPCVYIDKKILQVEDFKSAIIIIIISCAS